MNKRIKRGDEVVVISGSNKGQRGRILQVLPKKGRVLVEGVNMQKKHQKPQSEGDEGGIIEREAAFDSSNVMLAERYDSRQSSKA